MRASLIGSLAAVLGCHTSQPTPVREALPIIDGFVLKMALGSAATRLLSCNPPADKPAPATRLGRWCWASDSVLLIFTHHDSLMQMQLTTLVPSGDALLNATAVWHEHAAVFGGMMQGPPDSLLVKPAAPFTVHRWSEPRGANAQVLRACWLPGPRRAWYANVWLFDEMWGPDSPKTHVRVEVFAGTAFASGCFIGPTKEPTRAGHGPP
jgi:hypothetical protein